MGKLTAVKSNLVRKFMTGESRYCQNCGKESYTLIEVVQDEKSKNKLQFCQKCFDSK